VTQVIDIFIAAPRDVEAERKYADEAVSEVSARTRDILDIALHPVNWRRFLPSAARKGERIQDRFSSRVTKCGIFIGILNARYGTEISFDRRISGTEEEFNKAIANRHSIEILTYFCRGSENLRSERSLIEQAYKLQELQKKLQEADLLYRPYKDPDDFRSIIILDLFEAVLRVSSETERREQLRSFFRFGVEDRRHTPSVLLGYPAIHKHAVGAEAKTNDRRSEPRYNWQERLLPNVVYEDFKAIQKLEALVRFTGVPDISSVTIDHPRIKAAPGNRIWLCVPRNEIAQHELHGLRERSRFQFVKHVDEPRPHIVWLSNEVSPMKIESPLSIYLMRQGRPKTGWWHRELGEIVARDYAIISRFRMPDTKYRTKDDPFYHYFIAGIRGLGTWGAAWYIDRKPAEIERLVADSGGEDSDVQALVEVTFSNFRVVAVRDVSDESADYFRGQMADEAIDSVIETFR
jgi:hypothetical protein